MAETNIIKGIYKQRNGSNWNTVYFKTSADMVNQTDARIFLHPTKMTVNNKQFASISNGVATPTSITLYDNNIPLSTTGETTSAGTAVSNVAGALANRIQINGSTDTLTVISGVILGDNVAEQYTINKTGFSKTTGSGTATLALPFSSVEAGKTYTLATTKYIQDLKLASKEDVTTTLNSYYTKELADTTFVNKNSIIQTSNLSDLEDEGGTGTVLSSTALYNLLTDELDAYQLKRNVRKITIGGSEPQASNTNDGDIWIDTNV